MSSVSFIFVDDAEIKKNNNKIKKITVQTSVSINQLVLPGWPFSFVK